MLRSKTQKYPKELDCDKLYDYEIVEIFENLSDAKECAKIIHGHIYTQVDGDTDIVYSKGVHFVNRTGVYAVVR
jgi:hypothetical protein